MAGALAFRLGCRTVWLSALLTLALAALPGCGNTTDSAQEAKKKEAIVNSLRENNVTITRKSYPPFGSGYEVGLSGAQLTDDTFAKLKEIQPITELDLSKSSIIDAQMDKVNQIAGVLVRLNLSNTAVTDAGLEKLTNLNRCIYLNLVGTKVTREAVERFKKHHGNRTLGKIKLPDLEVEMGD
jgi:hypothetical protein